MDSDVVDASTTDILSMSSSRQWMHPGPTFLKIFSMCEFSEQKHI
jgi:hypothetical protein